MPGFYADGEYDVAGFIVGAVERAKLVDGKGLVPGDVLLALPSVGLHTNGYSLARQIVFERLGLACRQPRRRNSARPSARRCCGRTSRICAPCSRCSRRASSRAWRTSRAAA